MPVVDERWIFRLRIARELEIDLDEMRRIEIALIDKFEASNRFQAIAKALVAGVVLN